MTGTTGTGEVSSTGESTTEKDWETGKSTTGEPMSTDSVPNTTGGTGMSSATSMEMTSVGEPESCIQVKFDTFCAEESSCGFEHARYNRQKFKWRCYEELDPNEEEAKECPNEDGGREMCHRHATDSEYCNFHSTAMAMFEEDCDFPG